MPSDLIRLKGDDLLRVGTSFSSCVFTLIAISIVVFSSIPIYDIHRSRNTILLKLLIEYFWSAKRRWYELQRSDVPRHSKNRYALLLFAKPPASSSSLRFEAPLGATQAEAFTMKVQISNAGGGWNAVYM